VIRSQSRFRQTNRLPRAEVDADPDAVVLVGHQVHVVVARADGAELRLRELRELALRREVGAPDPVDHGMVARSCAGTPTPNEIRRVISPMTPSTPPSASRSSRRRSVSAALLPQPMS